jgi:multiple sugar transport system substrate-binding protein
MRTSKRLTLMIAVLLMVFVFSACSSNSGEGNQATKAGNNNKASNNGDKEKIQLTFMGWEASPLETDSVKKGLELFMEQNQNIEVLYTPVPGDQYATRLLTQLAGNSAPDVFFLGAREYRSFQKRDVLLDLTPYFNLSMNLNDFIPSSAEIMSIDGDIYGVSSCTVSPVLYYNKGLFDAANLPYPPSDPDNAWSWEEFVDVAKQLTIKEDGKTKQYGVFGYTHDHANQVAQIFNNNASLFNEDYTKSLINTPAVKEVMESLRDLAAVHGVSPEAAFIENSGMNPSQMLQSGQIGMLVNGSWALQELSQLDFEVGVGVLPTFQGIPTTHGQAHVHAASANTEHPDAAWKLIEFLSSEEYQIDLISDGLWMPNRVSLYTEEGIERWYNDDVHPEGFRDLIPFIKNAEILPYTKILTNEVHTVTQDELEKFFYDNQSFDDVAPGIEEKVNQLLAENQ